MKNPKQISLIVALLLSIFIVKNAHADIFDICVNATYECIVDENPGNTEVIALYIGIDYASATGEWLDCVTFTLPPGWTYISGTEIGTNSDADGNYITDTGNSVTFGSAGFCPGGGSTNSSLGGPNNSFIFQVMAPSGWDSGDCNAESDGDIISGITWDYAGDSNGEASPSTPGNNGDAAIAFDVVDMLPCTGIPDAGTIMQLDTIVCPTEPVTFDVGPINLDGCGEGYFIQFENTFGGTGGPGGPFQFSLAPAVPPFTIDADLNGNLSANGFPPLEGTWCLFGLVGNSINQACSFTDDAMCITFLSITEPVCQAETCSAVLDGFTQTCDGIIPGPNCTLDDNLATPTNTPVFELFFETDGSTTGDGVISAVSGYTTGQEIFNNLNSGQSGEVVLFGNPGDCSFIPFPPNSRCEPLTLDVYVVPFEYDAAGTTPLNINLTCPVETITVTIEPSQELLTIVETPGDCNTPATAVIGFDKGDGAGGAPDGDLDDPEDRICGNAQSGLPSVYPCDAGMNTSDIPTITAAELAFNLNSASPECYTDIVFTTQAECPSAVCPPCNVEAPVLAIDETTCPDGSTGGPISFTTSGGSNNPGEFTEYIVVDDMGFIDAVEDENYALQEVANLQPFQEVCIYSVTYISADLDAVIAELDICTNGLFTAITGTLPEGGNILLDVREGLLATNSQVTVPEFEALLGGMNGGPSQGGISDLEAFLPGSGITCPNIPPFCYQMNTLCVTGVEDITCPPCKSLDLTINFDDQPQQTTWEITDASGAVMFSGGPYNNPADNGGTVIEPVCLPDGCYDLTFFDAANDGMCPRRTTTVLTGINIATLGLGGIYNGLPRQGMTCGNYSLSCPVDGISLASGGGRFGTSETNNFCLPMVPLIHEDDSAYQLEATDNHTPQMRLLPNVVKDNMMLYYRLQTESDIHIQVVNISGKVLQQHIRNPYDTPELELNVSNLNEGFYLVQLVSGDVSMVQKFIKR